MNKSRVLAVLTSLSTILLLNGCSAVRQNVTKSDVNKPVMMTADYDYEDLRSLGNAIGADLSASEFLIKQRTAPILIVMGIQNRTSTHIDTKALTDTMRTVVIESNRAQFVNESRRDDLMKEQGYQLANCTPETQAAIGKQLGAAYMLTGSLVELKKRSGREVRVSSKEEIYYQLTMEVTDLETGLIVWTKQKERARTVSKPMIGW